ncbi:AlpA family phage regulatory protein [Prosthecochloris sp.]|uniref:helix-turn-helix transcriptional regulator n=1 Tax=Prosthecochloris sp. TaxID=290513 RepID=UPI0025F1FA3C|nr:AlpA family phage regulatory protein [Prosthecochloris sp.]
MNTSTSNAEKPFRYYRLPEIIGDRKNGIPAIIPICKAAWYKGIKAGRYPKPVKLSERTSAWRSTDIDALVKRLSEGAEQQ